MNEKMKLIGNLLLAAVIAVIVYIFLHESGHALVALLCGGKITSFSIIGAHTSSVGGSYNKVTVSLIHLAGMALPYLISVCYMVLFYKKRINGYFYRLFSMFFSLLPVMSLLAWIWVPIIYRDGSQSKQDDVIQFMIDSGLLPYIVTVMAVILFTGAMILAWKKGIIQIWLDVVSGKWNI